MDLERNPLRGSGDGGPGFCYESDPDLFRGAGALADGPLLVALDSNIIFDLEQHGVAILEQEDIEGVDAERGRQLGALGQIIDLWMMRDIRFVVVPRTRSDFRRPPSDARMRQRERTFERIESALTFQGGDWEDTSGRFAGGRSLTPAAHDVIGAASTLDALMLRSAWECAVDVFLTSDLKLLSACSHAAASFPLITSPAGLLDRLSALGANPMFLGMVDHEDCRWDIGFPLGDTGKWVALFEAMSI